MVILYIVYHILYICTYMLLNISKSKISKSWGLKVKFHFPKQIMDGLFMWFLGLLGLLHHITVDRKDISADALLLAAHALD